MENYLRDLHVERNYKNNNCLFELASRSGLVVSVYELSVCVCADFHYALLSSLVTADHLHVTYWVNVSDWADCTETGRVVMMHEPKNVEAHGLGAV